MGWTNVRIAAELHVNEITIRRDLPRLRLILREQLGKSLEDQKARSVAVYRRIQTEAWAAFGDVKDTSLNKSAYLNTIKSAEDGIVKALGIAVERTDLTSGDKPVHFTLKLSNDDAIRVHPPTALPEAD